jgi:DTW domain-containing protein YfiP
LNDRTGRAEPRAICARCRRPQTVCWCDKLPQLPTRTRVVILQHPREREVGIGTARMAHLALPGSILRVGLDFSDDEVVNALPASSWLLFPGPGARDVREIPRDDVTLVVVDGTWSQARGLVRRNPRLAALPRIAFSPRRPSGYHRIRREPADFCVSTIEALAEVLDVLEPERGPFEPLLAPFRAMVDRQEWFAQEIGAHRHKPKQPRPPRPTLGQRLAAEMPHLLCVHGEANGWPAHHPDRQPAELVQLIAVRPATGERFDAVLAPRRPMAPATPEHVELAQSRLMSGVTVEECHRAWDSFVRPDDVMVCWGSFYTKLAANEQIALPRRRFDLRGELTALRLRGGTLESCLQRLGAPLLPLGFDGRGGRRLAALVAVLRSLAHL